MFTRQTIIEIIRMLIHAMVTTSFATVLVVVLRHCQLV